MLSEGKDLTEALKQLEIVQSTWNRWRIRGSARLAAAGAHRPIAARKWFPTYNRLVTVTSPPRDSADSTPVHHITPSYDGLESLFLGTDLEFVRLSGETVGSAAVAIVELQGVSFATGRWSWSNLTRGSSSRRHVLFEMIPDPRDTFFHNVQATSGTVYSHGPNSHILDISPPQTGFITISLEIGELERSAETLDRDQPPLAPDVFNTYSSESAARFRRIASSLVSAVRYSGDSDIPPAAAERFRDDLITSALDMMSRNEPPPTPKCIRHLSALEIVTACDAYASAGRYRGITSLGLSRVAGYSERRVRAAFKEITGVSPMQFMRSRALHEVRLDLLSGAAPSVTDVAFTWGFIELGRFSRMYRNHFGELPSETLKTARRRFGSAPLYLEQAST
jgi:AraC-like DNA-binding protein